VNLELAAEGFDVALELGEAQVDLVLDAPDVIIQTGRRTCTEC
jgi:hypothetical protein